METKLTMVPKWKGDANRAFIQKISWNKKIAYAKIWEKKHLEKYLKKSRSICEKITLKSPLSFVYIKVLYLLPNFKAVCC